MRNTSFHHRLEAVLARAGLFLLRFTPKSVAPRLGRVLGRAAWKLDRRRREVTLDNLKQAYGEELTAAERERIGCDYYRNAAQNFLELQVLIRRHPKTPLSRSFAVAGAENLRDCVGKHGSVIFVSIHAGPWELLPALGQSLGTEPHIVVKPLSNPYLNKVVHDYRTRMGFPLIVSNDNAVMTMVRLLKRGSSIGLLYDLNQRKNGVFVDFFGRPAATVRAPGILAARLKLPVVAAFCRRTEVPYQYKFEIMPAVHPDPDRSTDAAADAIMVQITKAAEDFIRRFPDQWQWNYRRWKTQPERPAPQLAERPV